MSENSKIEWTDDTYNPWRGCVKVSPACKNCYAEVSTPVRVARSNGRELWGGKLRDRAKDLSAPLRWSKEPWLCDCCGTHLIESSDYCIVKGGKATCHRRRVFSLSLGDWLDEAVPIEWLADLLKLIHDTPNLDWQLLTKRPENWRDRIQRAVSSLDERLSEPDRAKLFGWAAGWLAGVPRPNVWIGTTVENQEYADIRIPQLLAIPAKVRFLSVEPMLGPINVTDDVLIRATEDHPDVIGYMVGKDDGKSKLWPTRSEALSKSGIHWIINGGESGSKKRPFNLEWARSLRDQCKAAGVAYFFKQIDKVHPIPADLMIREFPTP